MRNTEGLRNFREWDKEELKAAARRGQRKGVETKRANKEKRKTAAMIAEELITKTLRTGKVKDITKLRTLEEVKDSNVDTLTRIVFAQVFKAMKGDSRSAEFVLKLINEFPAENLHITTRAEDPFDGLTTEQLAKLANDDDDE